MSTLTKTSLVINVGLAALAVYLMGSFRTAHESTPTAPGSASVPVQAQNLSQQETLHPIVPPSFRWSQLESSDYRTYIANLRRVECPEQTIRDIISADLDSSWYAQQRRPLEKALSNEGSLQSDALNRRVAATELNRLRREETAVLATLLGTQPGDVQTLGAANTRSNRFANGEARMPLVFQPVNAAIMKFSDSEMEFIQSVQQSFDEELANATQDTNSPEYRRRWEIAQREADSSLRGMLGRRRFVEYEEQVEDGQP